MTIDAHQHFWDISRGDYGWLTPDSPLFRDFGPGDLSRALDSHGVDATILVQAAPTTRETDYLLGIADETDWVAGVVGWIDLEAEDVGEAVSARAALPSFVGIRPMLQDLADRAWIIRPELRRGLEAIEQAGLVFEALVRSDQLGVIERLAGEQSELTIILDHGAKPPLGDRDAMSAWRSGIAEVARHPNACCKLSGLLTELPKGCGVREVVPVIRHLLDLFGPDRLVWGSDWPVLTLAADYGSWIGLCLVELERHGRSTLDAVMGENARRIYKLGTN